MSKQEERAARLQLKEDELAQHALEHEQNMRLQALHLAQRNAESSEEYESPEEVIDAAETFMEFIQGDDDVEVVLEFKSEPGGPPPIFVAWQELHGQNDKPDFSNVSDEARVKDLIEAGRIPDALDILRFATSRSAPRRLHAFEQTH